MPKLKCPACWTKFHIESESDSETHAPFYRGDDYGILCPSCAHEQMDAVKHCEEIDYLNHLDSIEPQKPKTSPTVDYIWREGD